jgi:hypothetical protein
MDGGAASLNASAIDGEPPRARQPPRAARPWLTARTDAGARIGDLFARALALIFLIAWLSLGAQVRLLIGSRGLLPLGEFLAAARDQAALSFWDFPTLLWWVHGDGALVAGAALGGALALAALFGRGRWRQLCFALSTALYLSYAVAGRTFLSFQWDNLLLECGMLASFLPAARAAPLVHLLFRLLLFKLYFESGIAKWQSPLHDWQDGSAMTFYYETAPLPTWLGWYAHHLPAGWHRFESHATLALELVVPFGLFVRARAPRLTAAGLLTLFQLLNIATANYGFFCYLTLALHLFVLDDRDLERAAGRLPRWMRARAVASAPAAPRARAAPRPIRAAGVAAALLFVGLSLLEALFHFIQPGPGLERLAPLVQLNQTWRLVNTYHLFAAVTRERIEPELQVLRAQAAAGDDDRSPDSPPWTALPLWHKPGDPMRAPDFVAPHQPRVDFQLWFYGLAFQRREPSYVATLIGRLCEDPTAVQALFRTPLPPHPSAVRIGYWRFHFTSRAEARASGAWWRREWVGATRAIPCDR